jgi:hypothetical protein
MAATFFFLDFASKSPQTSEEFGAEKTLQGFPHFPHSGCIPLFLRTAARRAFALCAEREVPTTMNAGGRSVLGLVAK